MEEATFQLPIYVKGWQMVNVRLHKTAIQVFSLWAWEILTFRLREQNFKVF